MAVLLPVFPVAAQSLYSVDKEEVRREVCSDRMLMIDNNLWMKTSNPSALSLFDFSANGKLISFGTAEVSGDYETGDYRRAMDPSSDYSFNFSADSYNYLNHIDLYGSFTYTQQTLKGKSYSENYDPYNGNPYIAGSPLQGDYSKQFFAFKVAASSKLLWQRVRFGVGFDYNVGDLSRYNDPRSRVQLADYSITPGTVIELTSKDRLGVSGTYRFSKEKMLKPVTKSESIDRYIYYTQKGLAEYSETGLLFFSRRYVGNYGGVELQYSHSSNTSRPSASSHEPSYSRPSASSCASSSSNTSLSSCSSSSYPSASSFSFILNGGVNYRFDDVIGERKENPGNYTSLQYYGGAAVVWGNENLSHKLSATGSCTSGKAMECLQELITETNDQGMPDSWWKTLMKNVRYRNSLADVSLDYRITGTRGGKYLWDAGVTVDAEFYSSRYVLPHSSMRTAFIEPSICGGGVLYRKSSNEIKMSGRVGWHCGLDGSLDLSSSLDEEKTTKIRDNVTVPDYEMQRRSALEAGLSLDYIFVTLKKVRLYCSLSTVQYYSFSSNQNGASASSSSASASSASVPSGVSPLSCPLFRIWTSFSFGILY